MYENNLMMVTGIKIYNTTKGVQPESFLEGLKPQLVSKGKKITHT